MNNPAQTKALKKIAKPRAFKQCWCGSWNTWEAYEPAWVGWEIWCYTCGRKDGEVTKRPLQENEGRSGMAVSAEAEFRVYLAGLSLQERRDLLLRIRAGKGMEREA